jgi:hypothetical protein
MRTNLSILSGAADCRCRKLAVQVPTQDESENDPDIKDVLQSAQSIPETVPVVTNHTNVGGPSDILLNQVPAPSSAATDNPSVPDAPDALPPPAKAIMPTGIAHNGNGHTSPPTPTPSHHPSLPDLQSPIQMLEEPAAHRLAATPPP